MAVIDLIVLTVANALVPQGFAQDEFDFGILAGVSKHGFMSLVRV